MQSIDTKAISCLASQSLRLIAVLGVALTATTAHADPFTYLPPGDIAGNGSGRVDQHVYVPGMRFPIEEGPAYANSQVHGHGGYLGPGGGQCDAANYSYPWRDNYCESRSWSMPLCPSGTGHQGQDIRASTCERARHWAVAAEDGQITSIGSYSVNLTTASGTRHRYLHLDMRNLAVSSGQYVQKNQRLGRVSNDFGGEATTVHLHYDIQKHVSGVGKVYVPTYMSLVTSYERLLGTGGTAAGCESLPSTGGVLDDLGPCFKLHGPPSTWRFVSGAGHDGALHWTKAWNGEHEANWAEWLVDLQAAGRYQVEVYTDSAYAQSKKARWAVRAGGVDHELRLDHSLASGWQSIGQYDFASGPGQFVRLFDNTGEASSLDRKLQADAIRLTPVTATPPPTNPPPTEPPPTQPPPTQPDEPGVVGCVVAPAGGTMDADSGCVVLHGPNQYWRYVEPGGHGGALYWTKAFAGSSRSNWAEWAFETASPAIYRVEAYNEPTYGTTRRAKWVVETGGQRYDVRVDHHGKSGWIELAELTLRPGSTHKVRLEDNTGESSSLGRRVPADAIRLVRTAQDDGGPMVAILPVAPEDLSEGGQLIEPPDGKDLADDDEGSLALPPNAPLAGAAGVDEIGDSVNGACACSTIRSASGRDTSTGLLTEGLVVWSLFLMGFVLRRSRR